MTALGGCLPALSAVSQAVLIRLLTLGPASRADLARSLMLSAATLTRIVRSLEEAGLVVPGTWGATATQRSGRPSQSLNVNVDAVHLVGITLTQTEMTVVRTDMRSTVLSHSASRLSGTSATEVVDSIEDAVGRHLRADPAVATVGISLAGPVSPQVETVRRSPFLGWTDVPLRQMVQQRLRIPVVVDNDVHALTAAEHWFGSAAGCTDFVLVTVGAGVGCAIVADDRLLTGATGGAGQIGHLPISESGPMCESGHRGCARAYLSTSAMVQHAAMALHDPHLTYAGLLQLASIQNPVAVRIVEDAGHALGTIVGTLATMTGPQKVVVTGEGAAFVPLVSEIVARRARDVEHWTLEHTPIHVAAFDFDQWARGAAVVALQQMLAAAVRHGAGEPALEGRPTRSHRSRRGA